VCFPSDSSIMLDRCFVPRCKDNYDNGPKVHVFKFPSDEALKQKWIYAVRRDDFAPTRHSKVSICRKSAWHLETWFHSENHYCCFYCCRFFVWLEKSFMANNILFTSKKADGDKYGAPFVKILYLTDLAQKLLSLRIFSYLCAEITISARI